MNFRETTPRNVPSKFFLKVLLWLLVGLVGAHTPHVHACADDPETDPDTSDDDGGGSDGGSKGDDSGNKGNSDSDDSNDDDDQWCLDEDTPSIDEDDGGEPSGNFENDGNAGVNPFRVHDGNVWRQASEFQVGRNSGHSLLWARYHNTRVEREKKDVLGNSGGWRHSWQYVLKEVTPVNETKPRLFLIQPSGLRRTFIETTNGWKASEGSETVVATDRGYEITTKDERKLNFVRRTSEVGESRYELHSLTSRMGSVVQLTYDDKGLLNKVADEYGHSIQLKYREVPFNRGVRIPLGRLQGTGPVFTLGVPLALRQQTFNQIRLREADRAVGSVYNVAIFAPGSSQTLVGKPIGSGSSADKAFDNNDATAFMAEKGVLNWCGLDLGSSPSAVANVIVTTTSDQSAALQGAVVEGYYLNPETMSVISEVEGSDGQKVSYDYDLQTDSVFGIQNLALVKANYDDGTQAQYKYERFVAGQRPMLVEADDPRNPGKAKRIRYDFYHDQYDNYGTLRTEINPDTGTPVVSLLFDEQDPAKRTVRYSDNREIHYTLLGKNDPLVVDRTDSLGRTTHHEYDSSRKLVAHSDNRGRRTEFRRDIKGKVIEVKRDGVTQHLFVRDEHGQIKSHHDKHGRETQYTRDNKGRIVHAVYTDETYRDYTYDEHGRLAQRRTRFGQIHTFSYNEKGLLITRRDEHGRTTQLNYDSHDRVSAVTDPLRRTFQIERNARGLPIKLTYPDGHARGREYDKYGRIVAEIDAKGRRTRYTRDYLGRITRTEDSYGKVTTADYADLPGGCGCATVSTRPTVVTDSDGHTTRFLYDTAGRLLTRTENADTEEQSTMAYTYDDNNHLIASSDSLGNSHRFTYDEKGKLLSRSDPLGRTHTFSYADNGKVASIVGPRGKSYGHFQYDTNNRLTSITDAMSNVTHFKYDKQGRQTALTDAMGKTQSFTYDGLRHIAKTYSDGRQHKLEYDDIGRVTKSITPDGAVTSITYDLGNRVLTQTTTTPEGKCATITYTYDAIGQKLSMTDALGKTTRWTYDARGNTTTTSLPDESATKYAYDAEDRVISATDALGAVTSYEYDQRGNMTSLADSKGNTYQFQYDRRHHKVATIYPDKSRETWAYDLLGRMVTYVNRSGQTKSVTYNAIGQPLSIVWTQTAAVNPTIPDLPPNITYTYDTAGAVATIDNGYSKITYTYDDTGRFVSETTDVSALIPGMAPQTVTYKYDALGRKAGLDYPDGSSVMYDYDALGRLSLIGESDQGQPGPDSLNKHNALAAYSFDSLGRTTKLSRDNGVDTNYTYDVVGHLTSVLHQKGQEFLASSQYTIDILGRRASETNEDNALENFTYDEASRLATVDYGNGKTEAFTYDLAGNRATVTSGAGASSTQVSSYVTNSLNQYTSLETTGLPNSTVFSYDPNGNLVDDGKFNYQYDSLNHLLSVTSVGAGLITTGIRAEFVYDATNRCILRRFYTMNAKGFWLLSTDESRVLTYDTSWNLLCERTLDGKAAGKYIHGKQADEIVRADVLDSHASLQSTYPLVDGRGSTVALTGHNGAISHRYGYSVYGQPTVLKADYSAVNGRSSILSYRFLFTGREWLNQVRLSEHRNRYYSPSLGRFMSLDPIGYAGGINLYAYTNENPINGVDLNGLSTCFTQAPPKHDPLPDSNSDGSGGVSFGQLRFYDEASGTFKDLNEENWDSSTPGVGSDSYPISIGGTGIYVTDANGTITYFPSVAGNGGGSSTTISRFSTSMTIQSSTGPKTFTADDLNYAVALIYAEASNNPVDQFAVASVLWNRLDATGVRGGVASTFTDVINAPNQFAAITGSRFAQALAGTPASPASYNSAYNQMVSLIGDSGARGVPYNYNQFLSGPAAGYTQLVAGGNYYYNNPGIVSPNK
jgi:RHS repeat-associated protein